MLRFTVYLLMMLLVVTLGLAEAQQTQPPQNGKIAFASNRDGDYEIYVMNSDGTNIVQLTNNGFDDTEPSWSPNGSQLAFISNRDAPGYDKEVYVMEADGSNQTRLTTLESRVYFPTWSPDGTQIAFSVAESTKETRGINIYTMNNDGSNLQRLTLAQGSAEYIVSSWSPDGERLAFATTFPFEPQARVAPMFYAHYSIKTNGTDLQRLGGPSGKEFSIPRPQYSLDGNYYIYHQNDATVYISNLDGSQIEFYVNGYYPAWSPDSTKIVFSRKREGYDVDLGDNMDIYVMNPDGSDMVQLTNTPGFDNQFPTWQPVIVADQPPSADAGPD